TLLAWVKWDGGGKGHIVSKGSNPSAEHQLWALRADNKGDLTFIVQTDDGDSTSLDTSSKPLETGQWYMVAGVYDGSTMRLYVNGEQVASVAKSGEIATDSSDSAWIGGCPSNGKPQRWDGAIDEAAILDKALTAEELQDLYGSQATMEMVRWHD
ncbi:MAG: LamG domain-containing protein, partial [Planctomycetota bacterium]